MSPQVKEYDEEYDISENFLWGWGTLGLPSSFPNFGKEHEDGNTNLAK